MTQTPPQPLKVVAVSGTLSTPSKTDALVDAVLDELALVLPIERHVIRVSELGPLFAGALTRDQLDERVERELRAVEGADLLIAASPVYRASFTGLFKHFFDFVEQYALVDVPVLLAATGGSERHALILEHSLRPLFGFFQALTLPLGVYAHASDFTDRRVTAPLLQERIRAAIARGLPLIRSSVDEKRRIERAVSGVGDELDALPAPAAQDAVPVRLYS
jgi:FMN reductase